MWRVHLQPGEEEVVAPPLVAAAELVEVVAVLLGALVQVDAIVVVRVGYLR